MKSKFLFTGCGLIALFSLLFVFACPARSGTNTMVTQGLEFVNVYGQAITQLQLENLGEPGSLVHVRAVPKGAIDDKYTLTIVADAESNESPDNFTIRGNDTIFANRYGATATLKATLDSDDTKFATLALSVVDAVPSEFNDGDVISTGNDSNEIILPLPDGTNLSFESFTAEPSDAVDFDSENPGMITIGDNVPKGTLITITSTLSDGSVVVYNVVKEEVVQATNIFIDETQDFQVVPGQGVDIPVSFSPNNCTYHDTKYITFDSSNKSVVTVENGKAYLAENAAFGSSATITGTSRDKKTFTFTVVNNNYTPTAEYDLESGDISEIHLIPSADKTFENATLTCIPEGAVTFDNESSNLIIDEDVENGTLITCTITYSNGETETFSLVKDSIVELNELSIAENINIVYGQKKKVELTFVPENATYKDFYLEVISDNDSVIDDMNTDLDNYTIAIVNNADRVGKTATLKATSKKYDYISSNNFTYRVTDNIIISVSNNNYKMIKIDGGSFVLGDDNDDKQDNEPVNVTVSDFYLLESEVTQLLYQSVIGSNPSSFKGNNLPVEQVSWSDAVDFCNKLSNKLGYESCYSRSGNNTLCDFSKNGFRLPTEAEWEYAAKGGIKSQGYKYSGSNTAENVAWFASNSSQKTHNVKSKNPNELGLYDMSGNVCEWCWDWYSSPYTAGNNPLGPTSGENKIFRGSGWLTSQTYNNINSWWNVSYRDKGSITKKHYNIGFRIVLYCQTN